MAAKRARDGGGEATATRLRHARQGIHNLCRIPFPRFAFIWARPQIRAGQLPEPTLRRVVFRFPRHFAITTGPILCFKVTGVHGFLGF